MTTEAILVMDFEGGFAAHDFLEVEVTQLEPRSVSNGRRPMTPGPSNPPPTFPTKSFSKVGVSGPRHTSITATYFEAAPCP